MALVTGSSQATLHESVHENFQLDDDWSKPTEYIVCPSNVRHKCSFCEASGEGVIVDIEMEVVHDWAPLNSQSFRVHIFGASNC